MSKQSDKIMDKLLDLYDWHIRMAEDDYSFGYADAIAQTILDTGKILGEKHGETYKYEAYKRVMQFETVAKYWKDYPTPIASYFPTDRIRRYAGKNN